MSIFLEKSFHPKWLPSCFCFILNLEALTGWTWNEAIMNSNRKAKKNQPPCQDINFKSQAAWHSQSKGTYLSISNWLSGNLGYLVWCKWRMIALAWPHLKSTTMHNQKNTDFLLKQIDEVKHFLDMSLMSCFWQDLRWYFSTRFFKDIFTMNLATRFFGKIILMRFLFRQNSSDKTILTRFFWQDSFDKIFLPR